MSQQSIVKLLNKYNKDFLSAKEIGKKLNINTHTVIVALKKMEKFGELIIKESPSPGVKGLTKFYQMRDLDETFETVIKDVQRHKSDPRFEFTHVDTIQQNMLITEIRKLREDMKNAKK